MAGSSAAEAFDSFRIAFCASACPLPSLSTEDRAESDSSSELARTGLVKFTLINTVAVSVALKKQFLNRILLLVEPKARIRQHRVGTPTQRRARQYVQRYFVGG